MAKKQRVQATADFSSTTADALISEQVRTGKRAALVAGWGEHGWTPELRAQAATLAKTVCEAKAHKHDAAYDSCMGCRIGAKAFVRVVNGGPTSADVKAAKAAKEAAKAPTQAVAPAPVAPVQAPAQVAASIGFRPRGGSRKVARPALADAGAQHLTGLANLSEAELKAGLSGLVDELRRRGVTS